MAIKHPINNGGAQRPAKPFQPWPACRAFCATLGSMNLVKSKQRVADHGEVFTPPWMVEAMLDLVKGETERIDARFLEPACGSGNFLVPVLQRKLAAVQQQYGASDFEKRHHALLALMCCYGIELLADNVAECRARLLATFSEYLSLDDGDPCQRAAAHVLATNIIEGDALAMRTRKGDPLVFAEWASLGKGKFQRRDFRLDILTGMSAHLDQGTLFARHEIFTSIRDYPPATVAELATLAGD